eukprot:339034-Amphidinium_carterae.1
MALLSFSPAALEREYGRAFKQVNIFFHNVRPSRYGLDARADMALVKALASAGRQVQQVVPLSLAATAGSSRHFATTDGPFRTTQSKFEHLLRRRKNYGEVAAESLLGTHKPDVSS